MLWDPTLFWNTFAGFMSSMIGLIIQVINLFFLRQ